MVSSLFLSLLACDSLRGLRLVREFVDPDFCFNFVSKHQLQQQQQYNCNQVGSSIVYKDNLIQGSLSNSAHNPTNPHAKPSNHLQNSSSSSSTTTNPNQNLSHSLSSSCKMIASDKMFDLGQSLSDSRELRRSTSTGRREMSLSQSQDMNRSRSEVF